ncbi:T9SS type A sorting domain-containing protein, partial [bacterium]|nr:T9SS type A sorting domain-containing protein [bacterium]
WVGIASDDTGAQSMFLGAPRPNPMSASTQFECSTANSEGAVVEVYDVSGRVVWRSAMSSGTDRAVVTWDGRDDRGVRVPGGVYFLRLGNGRAAREVKVTVVR